MKKLYPYEPMSFSSRHGDRRTVTPINLKEGLFEIKGKSKHIRYGARPEDTNKLQMIDFEGGPYICVGEDFYGAGTIIDVSFGSSRGDEAVVFVTVKYNTSWKKAVKKIFSSKE